MNNKLFFTLAAAGLLIAVGAGAPTGTASRADAPVAPRIVELPTVRVHPAAEDAAWYQPRKIVDLATVTVRPAAADQAFFLSGIALRESLEPMRGWRMPFAVSGTRHLRGAADTCRLQARALPTIAHSRNLSVGPASPRGFNHPRPGRDPLGITLCDRACAVSDIARARIGKTWTSCSSSSRRSSITKSRRAMGGSGVPAASFWLFFPGRKKQALAAGTPLPRLS